MGTYRVSDLARRCGVAPSTVRFYEREGLLPATRSASGYRLYDDQAVDRLAFIASAKHLGLGLPEIGELLALWEQGVCARVRADLRPRVDERIREARGRIKELRSFIERLSVARAHLAGPDRAGPCSPECSFLHAKPGPVPVELRGLNRPAPAGPGKEPVACSPGDGDKARRMDRWRSFTAVARTERVAGGVRLVFEPGVDVGALAGLAARERECRPFLTFALDLGARVTLEVTAPDHARGLLKELLGTLPA
ncbi:MerR family transcriptional regulator [Nocardiopsis ansamitocini]|uniref:MerR family transcriptional regulator n=1 Tax=Nocardiopsis ansamitocini TaxID=1670832 RepID=UPI0025558200|nr:MerR family transcriptional regulator [Nocardiopsis ansamitocini]